MCFSHHGIFLLFFLHLLLCVALSLPLSPSLWSYLSRRGRDAPPPRPALIHPSRSSTHTGSIERICFCTFPPSRSLRLWSQVTVTLCFPVSFVKEKKIPAEALAWTGSHSWCPPNPKVFPSADNEIITCHSLFIWAAEWKFKCFLNVNHDRSLIRRLFIRLAL